VFPLYHIFAEVGTFAGEQVMLSKSSDPLQVESLVLQKGDQILVLVANYQNVPSRIQVMGLSDRVRVKRLDETNVLEAIQCPQKYRRRPGQILATENGCLSLEIKPYAIALIDTIGA
jgi:hypothetical protein